MPFNNCKQAILCMQGAAAGVPKGSQGTPLGSHAWQGICIRSSECNALSGIHAVMLICWLASFFPDLATLWQSADSIVTRALSCNALKAQWTLNANARSYGDKWQATKMLTVCNERCWLCLIACWCHAILHSCCKWQQSLVCQADVSSLGDITWKNGNGTNLVHQPLLQVWVLFEYSEHHLLPSDPHASNISQYSAWWCMRTWPTS